MNRLEMIEQRQVGSISKLEDSVSCIQCNATILSNWTCYWTAVRCYLKGYCRFLKYRPSVIRIACCMKPRKGQNVTFLWMRGQKNRGPLSRQVWQHKHPCFKCRMSWGKTFPPPSTRWIKMSRFEFQMMYD